MLISFNHSISIEPMKMIARTRAKDNSMVTPSMSSKILLLKRKLV